MAEPAVLRIKDAASRQGVPGAVVYEARAGTPRRLVLNSQGEYPTADLRSGADLFAVVPGYYVERLSLQPEPDSSSRDAYLTRAPYLSGQFSSIPPQLSSKYDYILHWDYRETVTDHKLRHCQQLEAWCGEHTVDADGGFRIQHLFPKDAYLVVLAQNTRTGLRYDLSRILIDKDQTWVDVDLSGVSINERKGSLTADILFEGTEPQGSLRLELSSDDGHRVPFASHRFSRRPGTSRATVTIPRIAAGHYVPVLSSSSRYATYRFGAVDVRGDARVVLHVPVGASFTATVLGTRQPDIRSNPISLWLYDEKGQTTCTSYLRDSNKIHVTAVPPGRYLASVKAPVQSMMSRPQKIELRDGEVATATFDLEPCRIVTIHLATSPERSGTIFIEDATGELVQTKPLSPGSQRKRTHLPLGSYKIRTTLPYRAITFDVGADDVSVVLEPEG